MYRILYLVLTFILLFSLMGCSFDNQNKTSENASSEQNTVIKLQPIPKATSTSTPKPTQTQAPTPEPTQAPTPTPNDGRTQIAEDFFYKPLDDAIKEKITGSSFPEKPQDNITYESLNYIQVLHYNFEGEILTGELIVAKDLAPEVTEIFYMLYLEEYPLTSIKLIDEFGGSEGDKASMTVNNTSAFNYRTVSGTSKLSNHAMGRAIDVNPLMNPYVKGDYISPQNAVEYADRSNIRLGMIDETDLCYKLFTENGWEWGGDWKYSKDYQHFQKD